MEPIRALPKNKEAEQAVLGSILLDADTELAAVQDILRPRDFYYRPHRIIYDTICRMADMGKIVDLISVSNRLEEDESLERSGGRLYLNELLDSLVTTASTVAYAKIIKKKSDLRALIEAGSQIVEIGYNETAEINEAKDSALDTIMEAIEDPEGGEIQQISELIDPFMSRIKEAGEGNIGLTCGYPTLDRYAWGFKGKLTVIAGASSMGKSVFMLNSARRMAKEGIPVGFLSMEMSPDAVTMRLVQAEGELTRNEILTGSTERTKQALMKIGVLPVYIVAMGPSTLSSVSRQMRQLVMQHHVKAIFVDYLQLMTHEPLAKNKNEEMGFMAKMLKQFAYKYDVGVFVGSQLNRTVYAADAKPELWMLRDSGNIENHADIIIGLWRPDYTDRDIKGGLMKVTFLKLREGAQYSEEDMVYYPYQQRITEKVSAGIPV